MPDAPPRLPKRTPAERARVAALGALVLALAAMWVYAWVFAPRGNPDRLEEQAWTDEAEARCALAREAVDAAMTPGETDQQRRAEDVDVVTGALAAAMDDLRAEPPANARDRDLVLRWLDDYDTYLDDRRAYADLLRTDETARFEETPIEGEHRSEVLDLFADVNGMQSCMTPGDLS